MAVSDFNPDQQLRNLPTLQVQHKDGSIDVIPAGTVRIRAGANMLLTTDEETDEIVFNTSEGNGQEDPYFREKYEALANTPEVGTVSGGEGTPERPNWTFSAAARWIAAINNIQGTIQDLNFFIANSDCTSLGLFDQETIGYPEAEASTLRVTDVCVPRTNLLTVKKLKDYIDRLKQCYDYLLAVLDDNDLTTVPTPPQGINELFCQGFLQQMQVMRHYWNYLVNRASVKFDATSSGQGITFSTYVRNVTDVPMGDPVEGLKVVVTIDTEKRVAGNWVQWANMSITETEIRPITRESNDAPPNNLLGWDLAANITTTTATATFKTIKDAVVYQLPPGGEMYADAVILFKNMEDFDDGGEYRVRVTSNTYYTNLDPAAIVRIVDVYFTPPVNPTPIEEP